MPGPGGPGSMSLARLLKQQVLVAAFPNQVPEVHVACVDLGRAALSLQEATVGQDGDVQLGNERTIPLADIGSVRPNDCMVAVLSKGNKLLVQMHLETTEDERTWCEGLRALMASSGGGGAPGVLAAVAGDPGGNGAEEAEDDRILLRARSQQLQNRIGSLEAISERRDKQLQKMVGRLDGAMQMLTAVQDMCTQQRKVIQAQKTAIVELRQDCGLPADEGDAAGGSQDGGNAEADGGNAEADGEEEEEEGDDDREGEEEDEEVISVPSPQAEARGNAQRDEIGRAANSGTGPGTETTTEAEAQQMLALLQQADEMQRMLQLLESQGLPLGLSTSGLDDDESSPGGNNPQNLGEAAPKSLIEEAPTDEADEEDSQVVLERLRSLEAEKHRFEQMLSDSQQEHQDLLEKLSGMRSLMSALGMKEGDGSGSEGGASP